MLWIILGSQAFFKKTFFCTKKGCPAKGRQEDRRQEQENRR
jgi:hypothetical protein